MTRTFTAAVWKCAAVIHVCLSINIRSAKVHVATMDNCGGSCPDIRKYSGGLCSCFKTRPSQILACIRKASGHNYCSHKDVTNNNTFEIEYIQVYD